MAGKIAKAIRRPGVTDIVSLAAVFGSAAKTKAGARRAVLEQVKSTRSLTAGRPSFLKGSREEYASRNRTERLVRQREELIGRSYHNYTSAVRRLSGLSPQHLSAIESVETRGERYGGKLPLKETMRRKSASRTMSRIYDSSDLSAAALSFESLKTWERETIDVLSLKDYGVPFTEALRRKNLGVVGFTEVLPADLTTGRTFSRLGEWVAVKDEDVETDWDYYSKAWHNAHGPKVTVSDRRVTFRRLLEDGSAEERVHVLSGWRGDYVAKAALAEGIVEKKRGQMDVRLNAAYDVEKTREVLGVEVFERSLLGSPVDHVVRAGGVTFHAPSVREAVRGLGQKIRKAAEERRKKERGELNFADGLEMGFCEAGIRSFCDATGLDENGSYTPDEILVRAREHGVEETFRFELSRVREAAGRAPVAA